jgi:predicted ester cyclase
MTTLRGIAQPSDRLLTHMLPAYWRKLLESTIEDLIAERDKVVAHWRAHATHQGEYMGIPPTGNRVNFTGVSIYRIEGGKIAESWSVTDLLGMMQQPGAVGEPGPAQGA